MHGHRTEDRVGERWTRSYLAATGLASMYMNEDERVPEALALLKRAFQLEPDNPAVLNHLANHHFYRSAPA